VSREPSDPEACVYVISYGLDRAKIGVAGDARKRLRELQPESDPPPGSFGPTRVAVRSCRVLAEGRHDFGTVTCARNPNPAALALLPEERAPASAGLGAFRDD